MNVTRGLVRAAWNPRTAQLSKCSVPTTRGFASKSGNAQALRYTQYGSPTSVLKLESENLANLKDDQVLVKMVAAPINPADLNMIEGTYAKKANLPAIAGNEGVGIVVEAGSKSPFKANQHVIPATAGLGTWRTHGVFNHSDLLAVPSDIKPEYAATVSVNPATAYRLLEDFQDLQPGDVIIQNGANSAVGIAVIQLAKHRGVKTINVVRDRPKFDEMHQRLRDLGADIVVTDTYLQTSQFKRLLSDMAKPKLALNCVGGQSATDIARTLGDNGTLVTYGGMSRKPVVLPTSLFIFKNIESKGFWLTKWNEENGVEKRQQTLDALFQHIRKDQLKIWAEKRSFNEWSQAIEDSSAGFKDRKIVLSFE